MLHAMERASPEFLPSNAVRPQVDSICGIKNTKKIDFGLSFAPDPTGWAWPLP